ncbi:protein of unknown function [Taphrina deformans PYCC 5710]|uniref:MFS transporter n=1 Tax=Taphrina deformans (strain PYCC 5710 / ATCC 11124 / CBS 356.35 / IMI 108563 / JCM 9778 / NBRC 8474) TaxID=1097556 RepID=R4XKC6_TAPDE|nr:protein of unknown function [Taphrina deformans PYCC 5710]|eukprot:CCG84913.1 protein of unknown function [Taphrina deformans PYCC 5710]
MLTPIITGKTDVDLGRRAPFYLAGGFTAVCTVVLFFFLEETAFRREDQNGAVDLALPSPPPNVEYSEDQQKAGFQVDGAIERQESPSEHVVSKIPTFAMANLALFSGRYSHASFIKLVLRPVLLCAHPAVFWGAATTGLITAWSVMLATVIAAIFAFSSPAVVGYIYIGPTLGALISLPLSGLSSDYLASRLTRRYAVYEPEYRLLLVLPFAITATIGLFGFGHTTKMHRVVPATFAGFVVSSVCFSAVAASTYIADAYKSLDVDCFIAFLLVKNLLAYALTVKGFDWLIEDGVVKMFNICGATQLGVCALAILMFIFGKVIRQWSAKSRFWQYIFH